MRRRSRDCVNSGDVSRTRHHVITRFWGVCNLVALFLGSPVAQSVMGSIAVHNFCRRLYPMVKGVSQYTSEHAIRAVAYLREIGEEGNGL